MIPKVRILSARGRAAVARPSSWRRAGFRVPDSALAARAADSALRPLIHALPPAARSQGPVLLVGESGVGKEYFARHVHRLRWRRDDGFVPVLASGVSAARLESLLSGAAAAEARGGPPLTIYIRSVELLCIESQVSLAAWLRDADRSARRPPFLIAATQGNLRLLADLGLFDRRIAAQLARFDALVVPPFRERREDRLVVAMEILASLARESRLPTPGLSPSEWDRILRGSWPGNVREVMNSLRQLVLEAGLAPLSHSERNRRNHVDSSERHSSAQEAAATHGSDVAGRVRD